MRLFRLIGAALLMGTVLLVVPALAVALTGPRSATGKGPALSVRLTTLTWADDFTGPAGSPPDGSRWGYDTGGGDGDKQELQYYTDSTSNAALDGAGHLIITARQENPAGYGCWYGSCQYTSARLRTSGRFTQAYGRFEASIRIPRGQGLWPAFWLLGDNIDTVGWPNSGEIDVLENIGREPGTIHGSLHGPGYSTDNALTGRHTLPNGAALADQFHTYTVDWTPESITFAIDGIQYKRHVPAATRGHPWVFDHPFFILLNVAVGGKWPGAPDGTTSFPQQMVVDYVHVYSSVGGDGTTGQITGYAGKCVDVQWADTSNGTPIQLWDCNGTRAQRWTLGTDGTIRAFGKCMDVTAGSTANGAMVRLYDCNGTGAQQWRVSAGDIVNPQANKCLEASDRNSANGTRLRVWDCYGGAPQKWQVPG